MPATVQIANDNLSPWHTAINATRGGFGVTDVAAFHEIVFGPQQNDEHIKEFKLEQKIRLSREATERFQSMMNDWHAEIRARRAVR